MRSGTKAARFYAVAGLTALLGLGGCEGAAELTRIGRDLFGGAEGPAACPADAPGQEGRSCPPAGQTPALDSSATMVRTPLYCYRTLAAITCYDSPDPQASPSRRVQ